MSQPTRSSSGDDEWTMFDQLTADAMLRINHYCDQFADLWRASGQTSLAQFLNQLPSHDRPLALRELIDVDLYFRAQLGKPESSQSYLERWPELDVSWLDERIKHHFHKATNSASPTGNTASVSLTQVGDYVIVGTLGSGGMGLIYRARHRLMGRQVALKVLKENHWQDDSSQRRFEREVQLLAKLSHPNIVTAFDARQENGMLVLVTELVDGEDLARRVKRLGATSPLQAMEYIRQAACGLQYAHEQGVIHRDIKPSNLLLSSNQTIKVLDLGLARWKESTAELQPTGGTLTGSAQVIGTPHYMAPEQARTPLLADHRADIYSLGCTLYYLLTGSPPYAGKSNIDAIVAHWEQPTPRLPSSVNGGLIAAELSDLVQAMMAKQLELRIQSMKEVLTRLDTLIRMEKTTSASPSSTMIDRQTLPSSPLNETREATLEKPEQELEQESGRIPTARVPSAPEASGRDRIWWIAPRVGIAMAILLGTILSTIYVRYGGIPNSLFPKPLPDGVIFDGQDDFISAEDFFQRVDRPVRIEVAAIAMQQSHAANLVSWSGDPSMFVFISGTSWGVAYQSGGLPQLVVSETSVRFGETQVVCGEWTGERLRLYIDGNAVATREFEYPMAPSAPGLHLGGAPVGLLPVEQGPRFFRGTIYAVRISELEPTAPASTLSELADRTEKTLYLFP